MFVLLATNLITNASQALNKVNFSNPTWDVFLILFFITFAFLYGIFLGRDKIVNLIVVIFFSYVLTINLDFLSKMIKNLTESQFSILRLILFIVFLFILFFVVVKNSILSSVSNYASSWWHVLLYSIIHTGLLISLSLSLLSSDLLSVFGEGVRTVFIYPQSVFVWVLLSILSLIFLKKSGE